MPGRVDHARLLRISMKIGLGESARFLAPPSRLDVAAGRRASSARRARCAGSRPALADPAAGIAGFHLYTFNEVARTERWRRRMLALARAEENSAAAASSQVAT